jgi:hypothetical protein
VNAVAVAEAEAVAGGAQFNVRTALVGPRTLMRTSPVCLLFDADTVPFTLIHRAHPMPPRPSHARPGGSGVATYQTQSTGSNCSEQFQRQRKRAAVSCRDDEGAMM